MTIQSALPLAFAIVLAIGFSNASAQEPELDELYTNAESVRQPASTWPEDLGKDFIVSEPERAPASAPKKGKTSKASAGKSKKTAKPQETQPSAQSSGQSSASSSSPSQRRSRLPSAVSDGFELRVRYNNLTSMFWVVKRADKYDLLYANSSQSKASLSLTSQNYQSLYSVASSLNANESDIAKCKESSMQLHVISAGKAERTVTMCVASKSAQAEQLRNLSQTLAMMVR